MWNDYIKDLLLWVTIIALAGIFSRWCWQRPRIQRLLQPDKAQKVLIDDRDELIKRCERQEKKIQTLEKGNEWLLDELNIRTQVRDNQRDRLDAMKAELEIVRNALEHLQSKVNRDV